ncbi:MAG: hypothetical protein AAFV19_15285 [Pseudomonadota bacterium]
MWRTLLAALAASAFALSVKSVQAVDDFAKKDPKSCRIEIFAQARAACLAQKTDARMGRVDALIANATATLQGVPAEELQTIDQSLREWQVYWQAAMFEECYAISDGEALSFERCRYHATRAREKQVVNRLNAELAPLSGHTYSTAPTNNLVIYLPVEPPVPVVPDAEVQLRGLITVVPD